jgi:Acyl-CoA reductase (LuxC)
MILQERINLLVQLGEYMLSNDEEWLDAKERAFRENAWFIPEFINASVNNIATQFLQKEKLDNWVAQYSIPNEQINPKTVGVVMAGNIPLVGFHDFLCVFISGHSIAIKVSSKDSVLIKHLAKKLYEWEITIQNQVSFAEQLKGCDAYIATGSNNSSRYFDYYFGKYPNIIRKNRTSIAVLDGTETKQDLALLADDMQMYFGLGCRNVTKLYVPEKYDFIPLLEALKQYDYLIENHKYKNNFDYHLALLMMGNRKYMNSGSVIFTEQASIYSPVSQINYEYYTEKDILLASLQANNDIQCIVGNGFTPLGEAQKPMLTSYADGVDTMQFLMNMV